MSAAVFVDASVVVAILSEEPGFEALERQFDVVEAVFHFSPIVRFEAVVALARIGMEKRAPQTDHSAILAAAGATVQAFFDSIGAIEVAIDQQTGLGTLVAWQKYGKTSRHKARLNFGDCFSYAQSRQLCARLFHKGDDFSHVELHRL